jgi:riboflavin synthase
MFTGIVEQIGEVVSFAQDGEIWRLLLRPSATLEALEIGGSVAVNGCCLTATSISDAQVGFDLTQETMARTSFRDRLRPGARVNLERPLRFSSRLDGHLVQGHVDGVAVVSAIRLIGASRELAFDLPLDLVRYCVSKGSIALDGVSLTCASVEGARITVALIPHTLEVTTLGTLAVGDVVNIETDMIAKYVEKLLPK